MTAKESGALVVTNNSNLRSVWYLHGDAELAQVLQFASYLLFLPLEHMWTGWYYVIITFLCD